jgi:hypothetical protein
MATQERVAADYDSDIFGCRELEDLSNLSKKPT